MTRGPLVPPPIRHAVPCYPVKITAQCPPVRFKCSWPAPKLHKCFLQDVFSGLLVAYAAKEVRQQTRGSIPIKSVKFRYVPLADSLPQQMVVRQLTVSHLIIRVREQKSSLNRQNSH